MDLIKILDSKYSFGIVLVVCLTAIVYMVKG